jgi:hypothetical protein
LKKGCFLKFIIIFTIILGVSIYLVQNKFEEIFLNPGKELLLNTLEEGWENNLNYLKESAAKDSLKSLLENYITKMKSTQSFSSDRTNEIIEHIESTFKDSLVDPEELTSVRELIEKELLNEN